jgi:hypothetical protein
MSHSNPWLVESIPTVREHQPKNSRSTPDADELDIELLFDEPLTDLAPGTPGSSRHLVLVAGSAACAGASTTALAIAESAISSGVPCTLIDLADPARSGLLLATAETDRVARRQSPGGKLRTTRRGELAMLRLGESGAPMSAESLPPMQEWLDNCPPEHLLVVDVHWDLWALATNPDCDLWSWFQSEELHTHLVIASRNTSPGLRDLQRFKAALRRVRPAQQSLREAQVALLDVRPSGRDGGASPRNLDPADGVSIPYEARLLDSGISPEPIPSHLLVAGAELLTRMGVLARPPIASSTRRQLLKRRTR